MRALQVMATSGDGTQLILRDKNGTQYSVRVDERLTGAVRGDRPPDGQMHLAEPGRLDVKQVQARVRGGLSVSEVADAYGLPEDRVARYASPIIDERNHVADRARNALARTESFDGRLMSLSDLVSQVTEDAQWDAWRREDSRWVAKASWVAGNETVQASWLLDSARRSATALDENAEDLARIEERERALTRTGAVGLSVVAPAASPEEADRPAKESEHIVSGEIAGESVTEDEIPTGPVPVVKAPAEDSDAPGSPVPAPRRKRASRQRQVPDQVPLGFSGMPPATGNGAEPPSRPAPSSPTAKQRPAVPSWDEVMFGRREAT